MIIAGHALVGSESGEDFGNIRVPVEIIRDQVEFPDLSENERPKFRMDLSPSTTWLTKVLQNTGGSLPEVG